MCEFDSWFKFADGTDTANETDWALLLGCSLVGPLMYPVATGISRFIHRSPSARSAEESTSMNAPLAETDGTAECQNAHIAKPGRITTGSTSAPSRAATSSSAASSLDGRSTTPRGNEPLANQRSGVATFDHVQPDHAQQERSKTSSRLVYYDFWRTICVCLVCVTHYSEKYVDYNVLAAQLWVLPVITMISGALYAKSSQPVLIYSARLLLYFSVGVAFNAIAVVVRKVKWYGDDFALIVLFQMAFVLLFMGGALVARPLKRQLGSNPHPRAALDNILFYSLVLMALFALQFTLWLRDIHDADQWIRLTAECITTAWLAAVGFRFLPASRKGLLGWILALWLYGTRIAHKEDRPGLEFHFVDMYMWAFVVSLVPLSGRDFLGWVLARSWPIWALGIELLLVPGEYGRIDQYPYPNVLDRLFRQYLLEFVLVLAFTCIPCAEGTIVFPEFARRHMNWLNYWCLFAYVSHWAIYILSGAPCIGIFFVYGSAPIFYFVFGAAEATASPPNVPIQNLTDGQTGGAQV